jgi:isopentenyl diphosphate isomerase/L-lactate dehydrogenase-like FMN-dependent dehydrogenase
LKGITTADDAKKAIEHGVDAIYLSNHGGRQLDGAPSGFETALEMYVLVNPAYLNMEHLLTN